MGRATTLGLVLCLACSGTKGVNETTVFAAASLSTAFAEIGRRYENDRPGETVRFNFLASSELATQIENGAPADVFASADNETMDRVAAAGLGDGTPQIFARNQLALAVPIGNPGSVRELQDLENDDLVIALCEEACPAGRYASRLFARAGIHVQADSFEPDVRAVLTRITLGEADVGVVYQTDVEATAEVEPVQIPERLNVTATYPIIALRGASPAAHDFVDFVLSDAGRSILARYGFLSP